MHREGEVCGECLCDIKGLISPSPDIALFTFQPEEIMAFLKRSLARLDLLFKKKQESRTKFYECVEKVIEARRSGCIDEDGNIVKPLDELLRKNAAKTEEEKAKEEEMNGREMPRVPNYRVSVVEPRPRPRARLIKGIPPTYVRPDKMRQRKEMERMPQQQQLRQRLKQQRRVSPVIVDGVLTQRLITPTNSSDEEEEKDRPKPDRITAVSNPMYRESFPLPEEDDGSEGYASASEVDHFEFNPTAFLERNRTSGNPLHHHVHRLHGDSDQSGDEVEDEHDSRSASRRVRFSDDVQDIENFMTSKGRDRASNIFPDPTALPVHTKIDLFEKVTSCVKVPPPLMNRHSDPGPRIPPRPNVARLQSSVTKDKVSLFEELSNPENRPVPPPRPRRRKLETKMNETKLKINFFEQLSKCVPSSSPLNNRASTPCL